MKPILGQKIYFVPLHFTYYSIILMLYPSKGCFVCMNYHFSTLLKVLMLSILIECSAKHAKCGSNY